MKETKLRFYRNNEKRRKFAIDEFDQSVTPCLICYDFNWIQK